MNQFQSSYNFIDQRPPSSRSRSSEHSRVVLALVVSTLVAAGVAGPLAFRAWNSRAELQIEQTPAAATTPTPVGPTTAPSEVGENDQLLTNVTSQDGSLVTSDLSELHGG